MDSAGVVPALSIAPHRPSPWSILGIPQLDKLEDNLRDALKELSVYSTDDSPSKLGGPSSEVPSPWGLFCVRPLSLPLRCLLRPHPASPASAEGNPPTASISCISGTLGVQGDYAAEHALRLKLEMQLAEVLDLCDDSSFGVAHSCALLRSLHDFSDFARATVGFRSGGSGRTPRQKSWSCGVLSAIGTSIQQRN